MQHLCRGIHSVLFCYPIALRIMSLRGRRVRVCLGGVWTEEVCAWERGLDGKGKGDAVLTGSPRTASPASLREHGPKAPEGWCGRPPQSAARPAPPRPARPRSAGTTGSARRRLGPGQAARTRQVPLRSSRRACRRSGRRSWPPRWPPQGAWRGSMSTSGVIGHATPQRLAVPCRSPGISGMTRPARLTAWRTLSLSWVTL